MVGLQLILCAGGQNCYSQKQLVLPGGIEPPTSSLPMKCSTTELRQQSLSHASIATTIALRQELLKNTRTVKTIERLIIRKPTYRDSADCK
jgi:hypothetical protein